MIVATAGHVDHGKTTLVRALTGIDTDRLAEEKRRGLSIDLGFAHADFGLGEPIGFVDVPGHERFVRNMVAGVAAIDLALLVIAADDGPMPQTIEHLRILEWLGVPRCLVAITKIDRVGGPRVAEVGAEIDTLLRDGAYAGAPRHLIAAPAGIGLEGLRDALRAAAAAQPPRPAHGHFRLAVDRSFAIAGAGLVVTGTVVAGSVRDGDALMASPQGVPLRVRGLEVHHAKVPEARAGMRCALNLGGADSKRVSLARGDWILAPPAHAPTDRLDVRLGVAAVTSVPLAHDATVQLHLGAASVAARVAVLEGRSIAPGTTAFAQLVLERSIGALHGDRFIVRDPSSQHTLGGGRVVDPFGRTRGRARPERLRELVALAEADHAVALAMLLEHAPDGIDAGAFLRGRNLPDERGGALFREAGAVRIEAASASALAESVALSAAHWMALRRRALDAVDMVHGAEPERVGPSEAELAKALGLARQPAPLRAALRSLRDDGALVQDGYCVRRPQHVPRLDPADAQLLDRVRGFLAEAGVRPPIVGELAAMLDVDRASLVVNLGGLAGRGYLVAVAGNRFFLPSTVARLAALANELAAASADGSFNAASYRDASALGRNLTIEVLEHLDRIGVTRFRAGRRRLASPGAVLT